MPLPEKGMSAKPALQVGDAAPDFTLPDDAGSPVTLSRQRGKRVVLYFYPKDATPGCTREACDFSAGLPKLAKRGVAVFGVSADSVESHAKFKRKQAIAFPLLSDADKTVVEAYGVWKEKSLYGRKFKGIERTTFVIGADGRIEKVFPKVRVDGHFEEVLAAL